MIGEFMIGNGKMIFRVSTKLRDKGSFLCGSAQGFLNLFALAVFFIPLGEALANPAQLASKREALTIGQAECVRQGWQRIGFESSGLRRWVLWKGPEGLWRRGAIIILHGGGGGAEHFCSGGRLVRPQIEFAKEALVRGYAVFALEATNDKVKDDKGRPCGKRFDFSLLDRPNIDLPYIGHVITNIVPSRRPGNSAPGIFMAGLSTGGYMTIRAASYFDDKITAFAPVSAGDPFNTAQNCDSRLSPRKSAKGILYDVQSGKQINERHACSRSGYVEKPAPRTKALSYKLFHHESDGIVDLSCMRKAEATLENMGYRNAGSHLIESNRRRNALWHLWLRRYNKPILNFFDLAGRKSTRK